MRGAAPAAPGTLATVAPAYPVPPLRPVVGWPEPLPGPAPPVAVTAVAAGGLASAVAVPLDRPGVGWLLAGLTIAAGLAVLAWSGREQARTRMLTGADRIAAAAGAVALLGVGTLRAAGWVFALCVLGALVLAAAAAGGGRTWRALAFAPIGALVAAFAGLAWVRRGAAALNSVRSRRAAGAGRLLVVTAVTALLLLVFGSLLASADTVFAGILDRVMPNLTPGSAFRGGFLLVAGAMLTAGLAYLLVKPPPVGTAEVHWRRVSALEWGLPLGALNLLFAIFVWVQLGTLFGWHGYVLAPNGPDYAEYARSGFGQLVVVTLLTFGVIAVVAHVASRQTARDRLILRLQVGVLCVLSIVIVASAINRLWLYQDAYGLTRLRLGAGVSAAWLGAMFLLVLAAGVTLRGGWLPRAVVGSAAATLLALALANPDALIARWNIDRALEGREVAFGRPVDRLNYLGGLSADAIPALDRLPEPRRSCLILAITNGTLDDSDPWYAFNLGRERARDLARHPQPSSC